MAVVFIARQENGKTINEGLCLKCAKELNIPQLNEMTEKMGISDEDIENMSNQLMNMFDGEDFEPGGAETLNPFISGILGSANSPVPVEGEQESGSSSEKTSKRRNKTKDKPEKKESKYKFLSNYCTNLTERARNGKLDNVIGRDKEIYRVIQILSRRSKNNPCLIGEPGVGKTAIAEGIAQKIVASDVPFRLADKELYLLDLTALVAGTQFRGQFESRVKGLINEVKEAGNVILFIDEVHTLVGTGDSEGSMSAANILKPALSRGEIQVIGATTFTEYRKHIENDSALERRFQPVTVNEPTIDETIDILRGIKRYYEFHHKVKVSDEIIHSAAHLSERYITDRYLPDKAIDLLDEACACRSLRSPELTEYEKLNKNLKVLYDEEEKLGAETENPDYERIANVKIEISKAKERLKVLEPIVNDVHVTLGDIAKVIELWTGVPAHRIQQSDIKKLGELEETLSRRIIGQDKAVEVVSAAIRRSKVQLSKRRRPASFIFVGPTGVGKTELVKVLSEALFDSVEPLIRLDMSEYMEKHAVSRLVGSPPGYVGYDDAGQLTEKVRRKPYSVILFDEIEKAHPDVMNILLQILDEGRITDSHGRTVNFENTVIVMTSNAGSSDRNGIAGFNKAQGEIAGEKALKALGEFLRPEFMSRVDEIVVFNPLDAASLEKIAALMLDELKEVMEEKFIQFTYDDKAVKYLTQEAKDGRFGARDLRKTIRKKVEDGIASILVGRADQPTESIALSEADGELTFAVE
ncbi:ATPase family associated with various cellular activities (AAA) [[Clostridium] methylpentosum DSM 5476]|uniref:ATPase family associated with various cellular activities (AAA) n=1 Tax=[Clostridium] methylpentosum DSM 5476 TaxID=537013 RepID=C0EG80_9FIRM|nr:ATPase family associated with various cellular activities (AAA) [[Clostridium] methylpentosum DSM 5476]